MPGRSPIILVDDDSNDGTADIARRTAAALNASERLADHRRRAAAARLDRQAVGGEARHRRGAVGGATPPDYILLSDADIVYAPEVLPRLVARAVANKLVLTSLMVKLRCESFAERSLIPAFIFFFQMLYPFAWVNKPGSATAAAAGGCMLVRSDALKAAGGIDAIRNALIDDCSLAKLLKAQGPIWLGLTERVHSTRPYPGLRGHPPHGVALGLCAAALLAAAARRHRRGDGTHLPRAAVARRCSPAAPPAGSACWPGA